MNNSNFIQKHKQDVFTKYFEFAIGLFGAILLLLAILDLKYHFYPLNNRESYFVLKIFFLNAPHIGLTYSMLLFLPELKEWRSLPEKNEKLLKFSMIVFISVTIICFISISPYWEDHPLILRAARYLTFLLSPFSFLHIAYQFRGIEISQSFKHNTEKQSRIKYHLFHIALVFVVIGSYYNGLSLSNSKLLIVLGLVVFLTLYFVINFIGKKIFVIRALFSLRYFLFVLAPFSQFAFWGVAFCHGIEYLLVYWRMSSNSRISKLDKRKLHLTSAFFALFLIYLSSPFWLAEEVNYNFIMITGVSLYTGLLYTHFYLDRQMFKMRDPDVKRLVGSIFP
jgi:hypothetical protein